VIFAVKLTKDDKYIISASKDQSIRMWDMEEKVLVHLFPLAHEG